MAQASSESDVLAVLAGYHVGLQGVNLRSPSFTATGHFVKRRKHVRFTIAIAVVVLAIGLFLWFRVRQANRTLHERDGLSRFREAYADRYPDALLMHTYLYLAERHGSAEPHYEVVPTDSLERVYKLADLDLEDAVLVIADRAGARLPKSNELDEVKSRVRTVDDLLRFLEPFFRSAVQTV